MDVDRDYKNIPDLAEGLQQYYDLEQETDLYSLNTGRVFEKIGVNQKADQPEKLPVSFIIIDNKPHLTAQGISYLAKRVRSIILITTNDAHPAFEAKRTHSNIKIMFQREN
ncbi:MAG: hypothetical protein ACREGH_03090 [Minisyncoccia bacterium]